MKDFRGQEASPESSKVQYRGSRSTLTVERFMLRNPRKSFKSMRITESNEKLWNRAKVSIGAAGRLLLMKDPSSEIMERNENLRNP